MRDAKAGPSARSSRGRNGGVDYSKPANRKARWHQKILAEAKATMTDPEFRLFTMGMLSDDPKALAKAEQLDKQMKAAAARGGAQ